MELGVTLQRAMQEARRENIAYFVYERFPGSDTYEMGDIPPRDEPYFKVEPGRITTRAVSKAPEVTPESEVTGDANLLNSLGCGFWFRQRPILDTARRGKGDNKIHQ